MKIPLGFFPLSEEILNGNLLFFVAHLQDTKNAILGFSLSKTIEFRKTKRVISAIAL